MSRLAIAAGAIVLVVAHSSPSSFARTVPRQELSFKVGDCGLDSLSFNGQPFLRSPEDGEVKPGKSMIRAALDALGLGISSPVPTSASKQGDTIEIWYPWGRVSCRYPEKRRQHPGNQSPNGK